MKTKAWLYISIVAILALLAMPAMAEKAPLPTVIENQMTNGLDGSASQEVLENENAILTTIQVTTTEDNIVTDGLCTLREAIQAAKTDSPVDSCQAGNSISDTITFSITGTITLVAEDLDVSNGGDYLVIDGGGEITISGGNSVRVFFVENSANLTLENLSITDGYAPDGGGIYNNGMVTIRNSSLSGNEASASDGKGGGIYNTNTGMVNLTYSTLSENYAAYGGGIFSYGSLFITNSTLSGNNVLYEGGGVYSTNTVYISSATVANNNAGNSGGGVYNQENPLHLSNTIMAENTAGVNGPDCYVTTVTTYGYNLIGNTAGCDIYPWTGDLTNVNPMLSPLQDNGGPTYTHALLPGSLAINHGNRYGCSDFWSNPLTTDQRGFTRAGRCDIGAYEWQPEVAPGPYAVYLPCTSRSCPSQLYFDDFSNPSSGWKVMESETGRYEYLNNEYRILAKKVPAWEASFPGFKATNYVVTADVRNATGVNGYSGILFGFAPDWSHFYFFVVNTTGRFVILQWDQETSYWIVNGYSGAIRWGTEVNRLKLERNGGMIWAYANGELLTIVKDESFTGLGYVGLITVADTVPNVDARFDNFTVEPITCGASYDYPLPTGDAYKMETVGLALPDNWKIALQDWQMGK
jgi:CSLREA domain-containing protein